LETLDFQGKRWRVINKVAGNLVDDPNTLKKSYGCDLVIKNNQNVFFILNELIDTKFEEI